MPRVTFRKLTITAVALSFIAICIFLYQCLEQAQFKLVNNVDQTENFVYIEEKLNRLETELAAHHRQMDGFKRVIYDSSLQSLRKTANVSVEMANILASRSVVPVDKAQCKFALTPSLKANVQMSDVYNLIKFDNQDGGVWKQGFDIAYTRDIWEKQPLKVFVVPHSHNDPGWIKTFDKYYHDQTKKIFNNMVEKLTSNSNLKFIYAEMSFFSVWWAEIDEVKRQAVRKLAENGQLEIVTGGWVMNDEANTHYFAMIDQLIEGHQFLQHTLGVKPKNGWAIDPFGHSSTMAYLAKRMGFKNILIQRVHYEIKKYLARHNMLEFMWRQNWDHHASTDMFTHLMPFYAYDVPHTCGPDPKICCQFDFKRLPPSKVKCPWKIQPQPITSKNVGERAQVLLDQYRKKSRLYRSNVLLVPLGDDFRYDTAIEWDNQYNNYQQLFDYMNKQPNWHVQVQFGTLDDYFTAVAERNGVSPGQPVPGYPTLSGDFFTYSDRDDHYWSGYYTSKPFYKSMDRTLEAHLRSAEILFSITRSLDEKHDAYPVNDLLSKLVRARRSLGLFQHHDAITGTAKDFVVTDYAKRLVSSIVGMQELIHQCSHFLLLQNKTKYNPSVDVFDMDEIRVKQTDIPSKAVIQIDKERLVVFYNSLGQQREEVVSLRVATSTIEVQDSSGYPIPAQVNPQWSERETTDSQSFQLLFIAKVPAVGLTTYRLIRKQSNSTLTAKVTIYNGNFLSRINRNGFPIEYANKPLQPIRVESSLLTAYFRPNDGMLQLVTLKSTGSTIKTEIQFLTYGTRKISKEKSGAYLFLPDGEAKSLVFSDPLIRVIRGSVISELHVFLPHVEHIVRLTNSPGLDGLGLDINNVVDITMEKNKELCMRVYTDVQNSDRVFYTDLNGFQIQKRQTLDKLPLQANFYPMPTVAFLEDAKIRFSLLTAQPLGVASLNTGQIDVMLDRRLNQDDNRGLFQGVTDNVRTPNKFRLLIERKNYTMPVTNISSSMYLSLLSHWSILSLNHPIMILPKSIQSDVQLLPSFAALRDNLPCDIHLLNLKSLQANEEASVQVSKYTALLLHRLGHSCNFPTVALNCHASADQISLSSIFDTLESEDAQETTLTLLHTLKERSGEELLDISPMEIKTYKVRLRQDSTWIAL